MTDTEVVEPKVSEQLAMIEKLQKQLQVKNEEIDALAKKSTEYLAAITEGKNYEVNVMAEEKPFDKVAFVEDMHKFKGSNLEYWTKLTDNWENIKAADPKAYEMIFGNQVNTAEDVMSQMGLMVKESKGNNELFRTLFNDNKIVKDSYSAGSSQIESAGGLIPFLTRSK